jgi:outer membrane protein
MNKISIGLSIVAIIIAVFALMNNNNNKIGYVDSSRLVEEYKGTELARASYTEKTKVWQANIDTLRAEFDALVTKYNQERPSMSAKEIDLQEQLLQSKQQQFKQYQQAMQQKAAEEDKKVMGELLKTINNAVEQFGKKNGFDFIFGANGSGNIAYGKETLDITNLLIEELNN